MTNCNRNEGTEGTDCGGRKKVTEEMILPKWNQTFLFWYLLLLNAYSLPWSSWWCWSVWPFLWDCQIRLLWLPFLFLDCYYYYFVKCLWGYPMNYCFNTPWISITWDLQENDYDSVLGVMHLTRSSNKKRKELMKIYMVEEAEWARTIISISFID